MTRLQEHVGKIGARSDEICLTYYVNTPRNI